MTDEKVLAAREPRHTHDPRGRWEEGCPGCEWQRAYVAEALQSEYGDIIGPETHPDECLRLCSNGAARILAALHDAGWTLVRREGLDAAWAEAEAALPEGYAIMLRGSANWANRGPVWKANAYSADGRRKSWQADGASHAEALRSLARVLRGDDQ